MQNQFGKDSIPWEVSHLAAEEENKEGGLADDKVLWSDLNPHSIIPCATLGEEVEGV